MIEAEHKELLTVMRKELRISQHALGERIHGFFQLFSWPRNVNSLGKRVFEKLSDSFSCDASEGLGSYSLIEAFLKQDIYEDASDHLKLCCKSFYALCDVLRILTCLGKYDISGKQLHSAIHEHFSRYQAVYGVETVRPKHHMATHLGQMLRAKGFLVSCFVHERKHRAVKRYANLLQNTTHFDKSVLSDVMWDQFQALKSAESFPQVGSFEIIWTAS